MSARVRALIDRIAVDITAALAHWVIRGHPPDRTM